MTIFILPPRTKAAITGYMQNFSMEVTHNVFVTCANVKIVDAIKQFLMEKHITGTIVTKSLHGILPEIVRV